MGKRWTRKWLIICLQAKPTFRGGSITFCSQNKSSFVICVVLGRLPGRSIKWHVVLFVSLFSCKFHPIKIHISCSLKKDVVSLRPRQDGKRKSVQSYVKVSNFVYFVMCLAH